MKYLIGIFGVCCVGVAVGRFAVVHGVPIGHLWLQVFTLAAGTTGISLLGALLCWFVWWVLEPLAGLVNLPPTGRRARPF